MKIKKYLSMLLAAAMLPMCSLPISAAEPITAEEVERMLFADNITTVSDSSELQETVYYDKQGRARGPIKNYIQPEKSIMIHEESSSEDYSSWDGRKWLVKSDSDWDGWYYLFINEGDYEHMNFNPIDSTANDGTSEAYFYMNTINDITDFEKIAEALRDVDGITSIKYAPYTLIKQTPNIISVEERLNAFKIESAEGTKYLPIRSVTNPYAVITDGALETLEAWQVYDASYALGFLEQISDDNQAINEMLYAEMGVDYPFSDEPITETDTLSQYMNTEPAFSDISQATQNQIASVNALDDLGFMQGYEDGTFRPWNTITRAEAAVMIYKLLGLGDGAELNNELTDIDGHWAWREISAVAAAGIINGYEDKTFRPDENIEYRHFLKMILGVLNGSRYFYDESDIIKSSITIGLTKNLGDFEPAAKIPRIHAAAIAAAALDCHITTSIINFGVDGMSGGGGNYDVTLIDYLNGKELHGIDLRLKYVNDRLYSLAYSYQDTIRNAIIEANGATE